MSAQLRSVLEAEALCREFGVNLGLCVIDIATGEGLEIDATSSYPAASVVKLPLLLEVLRRVEAGEFDFRGRHVIRPTYSTAFATGYLKYFEDPLELSLRDILIAMVTTSDDVAADYLFALVGEPAVEGLVAELGLTGTHVRMSLGDWHYAMVGMRGKEKCSNNDAEAKRRYQAGDTDMPGLSWSSSAENNVVSARDMARLLQLLQQGTCISPTVSRNALELLSRCADRDRLRAHIHPSVAMSRKTGSSYGIKNDVGIIFFRDRPVIVAALTFDPEGSKRGGELIARIGRLIAERAEPGAAIPE